MKNPLAYLKHIVKDPITTITEADTRKKEIMPLLYGSAGVLALGLILQIAAELDFMAAFSFIGLVGIVFCLFLFSVIQKAKQKFECLTCNKCNKMAEVKTVADFNKYVSFVIEKEEATFSGYSGNAQPTDGVYSLVKFSGSSTAVVSVDLTCPHCGEVKHLRYSAVPFKCHAEAKKVGVLQYPAIRASLETSVRTAVNDYNDPEKKKLIPYTIHSSKNPNFAERHTMKGANAPGSHPDYMGAKIDMRQDVDEMLEHYFVLNQLNGTLSDPSKPKSK